MKITTWNVNGIRAAINKGIIDWIKYFQPDILCFQETKAKVEQFDSGVFDHLGYSNVWNSAERAGYSGVGNIYQIKPDNIKLGLENDKFDNEGRVIQFSYPDFELFNIYFPNGGRGHERVDYKLEFYAYLLKIIDQLQKRGKNVIITGDFNTAHQEIDLKNPKENAKTSGFLPEERIWIDYYLQHGLEDVFRQKYPDRIQYTWWTYRFNARKKGIGWRLDYYLVTKDLMKKVKEVIIHDDVQGSDHCTVTLELDI